MANAVNEYEEARRQMLEENKKRMEELGLFDLMESFNPPSSKTPSRPVKQKMSTTEARLASRRSARAAAKPAVDYKNPTYRYLGASAADIAVMEAMEKALTELTNPAFVRPVLYTYTAGSNQGYVPFEFRRNHMPESNEWFTLEDEDQLEWGIFFNAEFGVLRKGWRNFSLHHSLTSGDICIFELVSPLRFRVQIFRYDQNYHDRRLQKDLGSNFKKGAGKGGPQKENMCSKRKGTVPEDDHVLIDRKPNVGATTLVDYHSARRPEARLSMPIDKKPKLEAELPEQNHSGVCREERLSIPVDRKPKLEPNLLEDLQCTDTWEARLSSLNPAGMQISECATWTLENPD